MGLNRPICVVPQVQFVNVQGNALPYPFAEVVKLDKCSDAEDAFPAGQVPNYSNDIKCVQLVAKGSVSKGFDFYPSIYHPEYKRLMLDITFSLKSARGIVSSNDTV